MDGRRSTRGLQASRPSHSPSHPCPPSLSAAAAASEAPPPSRGNRLLHGLGQAALGLAASAALLLGSPAGAAEEAGGYQVLHFPASPDPAVFAVQRTLVETWTIVTEVGWGWSGGLGLFVCRLFWE